MLPTEYLPDDYEGPTAGSVQELTGRGCRMIVAQCGQPCGPYMFSKCRDVSRYLLSPFWMTSLAIQNQSHVDHSVVIDCTWSGRGDQPFAALEMVVATTASAANDYIINSQFDCPSVLVIATETRETLTETCPTQSHHCACWWHSTVRYRQTSNIRRTHTKT